MLDYVGLAFSLLGIVLMVNEFFWPFKGNQFFISCPIGHSEAIEAEPYKKWARRKKLLVFLGVAFAVAGLLLLSRDIVFG